jgi:hypothetical protein
MFFICVGSFRSKKKKIPDLSLPPCTVYLQKLRFLISFECMYFRKVLRIRIRDPVLFSPQDPVPGSGMEKSADLGSGMYIPDLVNPWVRDPGWKKVGSGILDPGSWIRYPGLTSRIQNNVSGRREVLNEGKYV